MNLFRNSTARAELVKAHAELDAASIPRVLEGVTLPVWARVKLLKVRAMNLEHAVHGWESAANGGEPTEKATE